MFTKYKNVFGWLLVIIYKSFTKQILLQHKPNDIFYKSWK